MEAALKSHAPCFGLHGLHHDSTPSCFVLDPVGDVSCHSCQVKAGDVLLLAYDVMSEGAYINIYIFVVFKEGACVQHQLRSILDFVWSNLSVYSPEVVVVFFPRQTVCDTFGPGDHPHIICIVYYVCIFYAMYIYICITINICMCVCIYIYICVYGSYIYNILCIRLYIYVYLYVFPTSSMYNINIHINK